MDKFGLVGMILGFFGLLGLCVSLHLLFEVGKVKKDIEKIKSDLK